MPLCLFLPPSQSSLIIVTKSVPPAKSDLTVLKPKQVWQIHTRTLTALLFRAYTLIISNLKLQNAALCSSKDSVKPTFFHTESVQCFPLIIQPWGCHETASRAWGWVKTCKYCKWSCAAENNDVALEHHVFFSLKLLQHLQRSLII